MSDRYIIRTTGQTGPTGATGATGPVDTTAQAQLAAYVSRVPAVEGLPRVWNAFTAQGSGVRLSRSGTSYAMWHHLGGQNWARWWLSSESGLPGGGNLVRRINGPTATSPAAEIVAPVLYVDDTDASIAYTGTGWSSSSNASAYGGAYQRPTTSGAKATWTTPASTTKVGLHYLKVSNAGIAKVTIDGSATAANLLPTAQQLVDAGAPSSILTGGGGPFAATDRVLDMYAAATTYGQIAWLADDLAPGAHTVVIEMTAAKQSSATDSRIYIDAFFYATQATTPDTASVVIQRLAAMSHGAPVTDEYAILANAGGGDTWIGGTHGYEVEAALSFTVDDVAAAPSDGSTVTGSRVIATRTTTLYHPAVGSGATPVASTSLAYTVDNAGLRVLGSIAWAQSLNISRAYIGMMTVNGELMKKATASNLAADVTLTANDNAFYGASRSLAAWLWDKGDTSGGPGRTAALVMVTATSLNNWANSDGVTATPRLMCIEDRTSGATYGHKVYPTRVAPSSGATVANGTTWTVDYRHRLQWFGAAIADAQLKTPT